MLIHRTQIPEVLLIKQTIYIDVRGILFESFNKDLYKKNGICNNFVQDNVSESKQGVLRGLHFQITNPQGKLIQVLRGKIFDVVVDLRKHSKYFGKSIGIFLESSEYFQLWIPPGFAHGFYVLSNDALLHYKLTNYYQPSDERTLLWNDPILGINWPILTSVPLLLSEKDAKGKMFLDVDKYQ